MALKLPTHIAVEFSKAGIQWLGAVFIHYANEAQN